MTVLHNDERDESEVCLPINVNIFKANTNVELSPKSPSNVLLKFMNKLKIAIQRIKFLWFALEILAAMSFLVLIYTLATSYIVQTAPVPVVSASSEWPVCQGRHFLQHYRDLGCIETINNITDCIQYFQCLNPETKNLSSVQSNQDSGVCYSEGKRYSVGQQVPIEGYPCKVCHCRFQHHSGKNPSWKAEIDCGHNQIECPEMAFGVQPQPGCYFQYKHQQCCGIQVCPEYLNKTDIRRTHRCRYQSREYRFGEEIYPEENTCLKCLCDENWNEYDPTGNASCHPIRCSFRSKEKIRNQGCTPVYTSDGCCPIDFICPKKLISWSMEENSKSMSTAEPLPKPEALMQAENPEMESEGPIISVIGNEEYSKEDEETNSESSALIPLDYVKSGSSVNQCWLAGTANPIGAKICIERESTSYENVCGSCRCLVPPLFTCKANYDCNFKKDEQKFSLSL